MYYCPLLTLWLSQKTSILPDDERARARNMTGIERQATQRVEQQQQQQQPGQLTQDGSGDSLPWSVALRGQCKASSQDLRPRIYLQ